jgi:hypothetical protein
MPRPILGTPQAAKIGTSIATPATTSRSTLQGPKLQQRLREKRSTKYVQAMTRLDAGTHHADRTALESLVEAIANEFPELGIEQLPIGIVSQCYLGAPYEVHICDLKGGIIEHFETFRSMPPLFERGRTLSLHPSYVFIEIYPDTLRAVSLDGSVSVIER